MSGRIGSMYDKRRALLISRGEWKPWENPAAAQAHVAALRSAGLGHDAIAKQAGVSLSTIRLLASGKSSKVRPDIAAKVLAARADFNVLPDLVLVGSTGTRRRLQALGRLGWSFGRLAPIAGLNRRTLTKALAQATVTAATARAVRDVYAKLWDQPPPTWTRHAESLAAYQRQRAADLGWLPPVAWEDELLDLPDEQMWAVLDARVGAWPIAELRRAAESFEAGDRSPLTVAAARECGRRETELEARKSRREATHVG